jgi:hypothetical protein
VLFNIINTTLKKCVEAERPRQNSKIIILHKNRTQRLVTQVFSDSEKEDFMRDELNNLSRRHLGCTACHVHRAVFVFVENRILRNLCANKQNADKHCFTAS